MKYISIGAVMTEGTEHILTVCRGNNKFTLTGDLANVWLAGRMGFAEVEKSTEQQAAQRVSERKRNQQNPPLHMAGVDF